MLTEDTVLDQITITEDGTILVRRATYLLRDGVRAPNPQYHRTSYEPGSDVEHEDMRVRAIASLVWTEAVCEAARLRYEAVLAALKQSLATGPIDG